MIVTERIGGFDYAAIVGAHAGTDNPPNYIRVEGPGLGAPAEYLRRPGDRRGKEAEGREAIRYTVDNILLPVALGRLLAAHAAPQ